MTLSDGEIIEELDSWLRFGDALRADDEALFREMIQLCYQFFPAIHARDSPFPAEAVFMSLLLVQHRTIAWLAEEVEKLKAESGARLDT